MTSFGGTLTYKPTNPEPAPATLSRIKLSRTEPIHPLPYITQAQGRQPVTTPMAQSPQKLCKLCNPQLTQFTPLPCLLLPTKSPIKAGGPHSPLSPLCLLPSPGAAAWPRGARASEGSLRINFCPPDTPVCVFMSHLSKTNLRYILI